MTFFVVEQLAVPTPDQLSAKPRWLDETIKLWLSKRVLELSFTSVELVSFARSLGYSGNPFRWIPERRAILQAEIDAAVLHLYGLSRSHSEWILNSFTVLQKYEERDVGEFKTKRVILEIYDEMDEAMKTGQPYRTRLEPPAADERVAHESR